MGRETALGGAWLVAAAAVAGCLDAPGQAGEKPIDAGPDDGGDAQPGDGTDAATGCAPIFTDRFDGEGLDGDSWIHDGPTAPTFDGQALTLSLTGFDAPTDNSLTFRANQFMNEVSIEIRASFSTAGAGDMIVQLDDQTGDAYSSLFVFGGLLRAYDSGTDLCGPCPAYVEGVTWGWRFRPMGDLMSFEADTEGSWKQIATAPLRFGLHRVSLYVNTAVESDVAELRLDEFTISSCTE